MYGILVDSVRNDCASNNITTGAFLTLKSATAGKALEIEVFSESSDDFILAVGASGAERTLLRIPPGGLDRQPIFIDEGARLSAKAVSASMTTGRVIINLFGG